MAYGIGEVRGMRDIGKNIRTLRERRGLTQEELAQALFVTRQTVSNYETGKSRPDIDMLVSIAQVLETDVNQVLYGLPPEQDRQREVRYLAVGCLIVAAIFLVLTLPRPLLNEMLMRRYVGALLVMTLTYLLRPALWLVLGWCALQGLSLLFRAVRPLEERLWVRLVRRGLLLLLAVYVVLFLPSLVVGLIQVIQTALGVPYEALVEIPEIPVYTWLLNRLLLFGLIHTQVYAIPGAALWLFRFPKR